MKNTLWICGLTILLAGSVVAGTAHDDAADAAYNDGWQNGDNGGSGFQDWVLGDWATNGVDRVGIGSSTSNEGADSIDTGGKAFYIQNVDGINENYISVYRYLNDDLDAGQTFSFDMDVNWRDGYKGIRLRNEDDNTAIFLIEVGGDASWVDNVVGGRTNIGSDYSDNTQYHVALEQTSTTGGTWSVTRSGGFIDFDAGSYTGTVSSIQLFSGGTLITNDQNRIFYNNFDVSYTPGYDYYGAWTNQYNLSVADAAYDADPDNDNMVNLEEFSVGRDPTNDEGGFRAPEFHGNSSNGLVYVYTRYNEETAAAMNLDYSLVLTDDLTSPSWETNGFVELPPVHLFEDLVTVTNYVPTTDAKTFATLQVESL